MTQNAKLCSRFFVALNLALLAILMTSGTVQAQQAQPQQAQPQQAEQPQQAVAPVVQAVQLGETKNVHACGDLHLAGQFLKDEIGMLKDKGFQRIITLRTTGEIDWDEKAAVEAAGMTFIEIPFRQPEQLNDKVFNQIRELLADEKTATLFHCGSANRVGGVWLPYRVLDQGVELKTALAEAKEIGLRTKFIEEKALDYINRKQLSVAIQAVKLGNTKNVHTCGDLYLAGQFLEDEISLLKEKGFERIITLRTAGETSWDEKAAIEAAGMTYVEVPFRAPEQLTDEVFDRIRELLSDEKTATVFHCGSANRVGGTWLPYRVLDQGVDLKTALAEAKEIGLRTKFIEEKALDYISRKQPGDKTATGKKSVRPGINDNFLSSELDVDNYIKRFEIESREIYSARQEILRATGLKPGERIADIGAGTGLYTRLFSGRVGAKGWVYAVDISPRFIQHINKQATKDKVKNLTSILCQEDSCNLPPESIDVAFICDTYHHFEFPQSTMRSIHRALKPGGRLIVLDFYRKPGVTRPWLLDHVRAGQEVFKGEIEQAGFVFKPENQVEVSGLTENYFMRFEKGARNW